MSDEQIAEYLRSRARVRPPMDLVGAIADAVAGVPQQRHSWFAPFMPAAAAVAAAAVVVVVAAVLVAQGPDSGPPPGGSPTQDEATSPSPSPSPSATPAPTLLEPGDSVTLDAVDADGRWGSLTLTRGEDLGGYDDGSVPPESFVIEIEVQYVAEREPNPLVFGAPDWVLVGEDGDQIAEPLTPGGRHEADRPSLSIYPGAIDIFTNELRGWLLLTVPREAEGQPLQLLYQPTGQDEVVVAMPVREAGRAPNPVAAATPAPTPEPVTYVEKDAYPFTVIDSAEADALFETPDTCTNPEAGYTITYPDAWFTNTEIGDWPPCSWFSPTFYNVGEDENEVPPQVAIVVRVFDGAMGSLGIPDTTIDQMVIVDGFEARRMEEIGEELEIYGYEAHPPFYRYQIVLSLPPAVEPTLTANTEFDGAADYVLNKAVLDRIMALIQFEE